MHRNDKKIDKYKDLGDVKDDRKFVFGSIWQIRDLLINIPNADRLLKRNYHFSRCIVIVDNSKQNFNEDSVIISVAPISHRVDCIREFDIELTRENDGVKEDSIIMMDYIQPVLKKDLYKCVGSISNDKKYELFDSVLAKMGLADSEISVEENDDKNGTTS